MKTLLLKRYLFAFLGAFLLSGCSYTTYNGSMTYPQNIMFDNANFKYVKTINGSSRAAFTSLGFDKVRASEGLINSAKTKMYSTHTFMPNQVITNISKDVISTVGLKGRGAYQVKVVMSADIYEFSNNGTYSTDNSNQNVVKTKTNNFPEPIVDEPITEQGELTDQDTIGYSLYNTLNSSLLQKKDMIVFQIENVFYKGTVLMRSGNSVKTVSVYKVTRKKNNQWVESLQKQTYNFIPKSYIIYIKKQL